MVCTLLLLLLLVLLASCRQDLQQLLVEVRGGDLTTVHTLSDQILVLSSLYCIVNRHSSFSKIFAILDSAFTKYSICLFTRFLVRHGCKMRRREASTCLLQIPRFHSPQHCFLMINQKDYLSIGFITEYLITECSVILNMNYE